MYNWWQGFANIVMLDALHHFLAAQSHCNTSIGIIVCRKVAGQEMEWLPEVCQGMETMLLLLVLVHISLALQFSLMSVEHRYNNFLIISTAPLEHHVAVMHCSIIVFICFISHSTQLESKALNIISYIGLAISLSCLLLTIIFFLTFGYVSPQLYSTVLILWSLCTT